MARTKQAARRLNNTKKTSPKKLTIRAPFQHAHLSDDELFNTPYELITTDAFMRLAHKYTIKEIYERFHAVQPDLVRKQLQIANRFNYVTRMAAQDSGRDASGIRAQIDEARNNSNNITLNDAAEVEVDEVNQSAEDRKVVATPSVRSSSALAPK
jgi:hypothetical protein